MITLKFEYMEEYIEINKIGLTQLDNGRHYEYHNYVYNLLSAADATKIGVPATKIAEYKGCLDVEGELNLETQASSDTQRMLEADKVRDRLLFYIFGTIRTGRYSPEEAEAEAAMELEVVIRPYSRIQKMASDKESAAIDGLLIDLRKAANATHLTTLRLAALLPKLEAANAEFRKVYASRSSARADNKETPSAKEARAKTDAVFDRIAFMLQAAYFSGAAPLERTLIASIVKQMNQRMEETYEKYRYSLALKRANAKKKPKDPKQPKDPKPTPNPKPGDGDDIHQPEEPPKKPDTGGGDDIHLPEEPPKKPDDTKQPEGH